MVLEVGSRPGGEAMEVTEQLYEQFLEELELLRTFRIAYTGLFPGTPLDRDDPDVDRIIEAIALFSARGKQAGQRTISKTLLRLFQQHFSYLTSPVPAAAMLYATISAGLIEEGFIDENSQVDLVARKEPGDSNTVEGRTATFRTLWDLRILPVELRAVDLIYRDERGFRLVLEFGSYFKRLNKIGELNLYVEHLKNFGSSAFIFYHLKESFKRAEVYFDTKVTENSRGQACETYFGEPKECESSLPLLQHPLEKVRAKFHFPQQELYVNIRVESQPVEWSGFTLCLDLDSKWPSELQLTANTFNLNVVPIVNLERATAVPITCNGKIDRYPVVHPASEANYSVHSVEGAYKMDEAGLLPIRPAIVEDESDDDTYELAFAQSATDRVCWFYPDLKNAVLEPESVSIEALWFQKHLDGRPLGELTPFLASGGIPGVELMLSESIERFVFSRMTENADGLLQLLSMKNQRFLSFGELMYLLEVLGADKMPSFAAALGSFSELSVESSVDTKTSTGFRYIYRLLLRRAEVAHLPALDLLSKQIVEILSLWSVENIVKLVVDIPNLEIERTYS